MSDPGEIEENLMWSQCENMGNDRKSLRTTGLIQKSSIAVNGKLFSTGTPFGSGIFLESRGQNLKSKRSAIYDASFVSNATLFLMSANLKEIIGLVGCRSV